MNKPKITGLLASVAVAVFALGSLSACNMNQSSAVERAQQNLLDVRAESAKNIQQAEAELAEVIAKTSAKLEAARRDLPANQPVESNDGTVSGSTAPAEPTLSN